MKLTNMLMMPAAVIMAFTLGAPLAHADERHGDHDRGRSGQAVQRNPGNREQARHDNFTRGNELRGNNFARAIPRAEAPARVAPHVESHAVAPQARGYVAPRGYGYVGPRHFGYVAPRVYVAPRPWTWFRPRFHVGFGVFLGYPVGYPYPYPYVYPVEPAYGYPAPTEATVAPGAAYGGVSFQITPNNASVYVDGNFVGTADNFYDPEHPLTLTAGSHRIEIAADGYETMTFDANIVAGQVLPYQGTLQAN